MLCRSDGTLKVHVHSTMNIDWQDTSSAPVTPCPHLQLAVDVQSSVHLPTLDAHVHHCAVGVHIGQDGPTAHLSHQLHGHTQLLALPAQADGCRVTRPCLADIDQAAAGLTWTERLQQCSSELHLGCSGNLDLIVAVCTNEQQT